VSGIPERSTRTLTPAAAIGIAAALFATVLVGKLAVRAPGFGFPLLYDIPVALLAIALGLRAGLAGAAVGMVLYAIGDAVGEIHSNVWGYASRALTFVVLGGLLGLYSDRLRRAEARTRESEAHFRAGLEESPIVVWQQDRDLRYTWINNPPFDLGADDILGKTDADLMDHEAASRLTAVKQEVLQTGRGTRIEVEYQFDGAPAWFDVTLNPLRAADGHVAGITAAGTNITSLKEMQEELRRSQAGLNRSQEMAGLGSWEWDIEADVVTWSDELHRLYGTSPSEFEASYEAFLDRVHPDDRERVERAVKASFTSGEPFEFDHRVVRPDGGTLTLHAYGEVTRDEDGKPMAMAGTGQDVTLHRAAEDANRRLAAIVDQTEDAIVAKDPQGIITGWNHGAERLYRYSAEEAIGNSISMLFSPDRADEEWSILSRIVEGQTLDRYETVRRRKDGGEVEVWLTITPIRDADGTIVGASSIARDMGQLKRTQRDLERSNAELEEFAYVASHDLSEPLRSIGGFVQLLERRYKGQLDAEADSFIDFIGAGVDRLQALIDDLLSYSRAGQGQLRSEPVDSRQLVERTLASLDAVVREAGAEVELRDLPTLSTDPRVLGQLFQNLLSNAFKFTDGRQPHVEVSAEHEQDAWSFAVADNGIGVDPDKSERIFGMFQRLHAREEYGGTGIGLAICKRMVERVGGRIWCEPAAAGGTVFRFTIPDSEEPS
jgi:PAS domain S-box-containing protein